MIPIAYAPRIDRPHPAMIFCAPREPSLATEVAMGMERWNPKRETTRQEEFLLKRLHRTRKLFGFLRLHRHELLDDAFQTELESMYRTTGAGQDPCRFPSSFTARSSRHLTGRTPTEGHSPWRCLRWQEDPDRRTPTEGHSPWRRLRWQPTTPTRSFDGAVGLRKARKAQDKHSILVQVSTEEELRRHHPA